MADMTKRLAVDYIRAIMAPDQVNPSSNASPDTGASSNASFPSSVDFSLVYTVAPLATNQLIPDSFLQSWSDAVPYGEGLYLSFPIVSISSRYHMGIVPSNSFLKQSKYVSSTLAAPIVRGLDITRIVVAASFNGAASIGAQMQPAWALKYNAELALPRVGVNQSLTISPNLSANYSRIREYAGKMSISSTQVQGTALNLTGIVTTAVVADTRDLCQQVGANNVTSAYPTSALATQAVNRGDVLKNSQIYDGVVDIVGCDYPTTWTAPDIDKTDTLYAEYVIVPVAPRPLASLQISAGAGGPAAVAQVFPIQMISLWITPWDTDFWVAWNDQYGSFGGDENTAPLIHKRIRTDPINEDGALDIKLSYRLVATPVMPSGDDESVNVTLMGSVTHVFARIEGDGHTHYNTVTENFATRVNIVDYIYSYGITGGSAIATRDTIGSGVNTHMFESRMTRTAFLTEGKYLGSHVSARVVINIGNGQIVGGPFFIDVSLSDINVAIRARNIQAEGRIGPCHIVRYDNVAIGQDIQFSGVSLIQGVALGKLQPFVQKQSGSSQIPDDVMNRILENLFSNSMYFKRMTTLKYYNEIIMPFLKDLDVQQLKDEVRKAEHGELVEAAGNAAGLFGDIGNVLGGMFGLGGLGKAVGGVVDTAFGSSAGPYMGSVPAQFATSLGSGESAGQFGAAAGQFGQYRGESAGQFGMGSSAGQFGMGSSAGQFGMGSFAENSFNAGSRRPRQ